MARKKSYKEIGSQFNRIWHKAVESSDAYAGLKAQYPDYTSQADKAWLFQRADEALRRGLSTAKDRVLNSRINAADRISQRYRQNIARKAGISEMVHYSGTTEQRAANDIKENQKYSRNTYMGIVAG